MRARSRLLGALAAAVVVVLSLPAAGAGAAGSSDLGLRLVSQSLAVDPGGDASIVVQVEGTPAADAELVVTVSGELDPAVAGVRSAIAGNIRTPTVGLLSFALADVPRDAAGRLTITVPTAASAADKRKGAVRLADAGVYPVRVDLRTQADQVEASLTTFLVRRDDPGTTRPPLQVALVLPLDAAPTLQPDGTSTVAAPDRARAVAVADALDRQPGTEVTLEVRPDLLEGLQRSGLPADRDLLNRLAAAAAGRAVATTTSVDLDPVALQRNGLTSELATSLRAAEDTLAAVLPQARPSRDTYVSQRNLDGNAIVALRDLGVRRLVLPAGVVLPADADPTVVGDMPVGTPPTGVPAAIVDPALQPAFKPSADPVLTAHQLLAELAAYGFDHTDQTGGATPGVVLLPPADWTVDPVFLGTLLDGLRASPFVNPVDLDGFFRNLAANQPTGPQTRLLTAYEPAPLGDRVDRLRALRAEQASLATMVPAATAELAAVDDHLQTALAATIDPAVGSAHLDAASSALGRLANAVEPIAPQSITLAGRTTEIPITLRSNLPYPVTVRVRASSPKLTFPAGDQQVTVNGTAQVRIPVEARANGTFPLRIDLLTPDGNLAVAPTAELTVRVSALAGLGIAITVGLGVVLLTWWAHQLRKSRRAKRAEAAAESATRHPAGGALPPPEGLPVEEPDPTAPGR